MCEGLDCLYECEDCGCTSLIKTELDEEVIYCPHCGNNYETFKKVHRVTLLTKIEGD